jgi:hypothetical protein
MKWITRSSQQNLKMPTTQVYHLLDNQMSLAVRAWGSQEFNQKFIDEVSFYLSSAQADLDVTSPFDFRENLSSLANKTRIALLLAHDFFYKSQNKTEFAVGFEAAVFFQNKNELAWSSVGRFSLKMIKDLYLQTVFDRGTDRDQETLLPVELIGVEKEVEISSGSVFLDAQTQLLLSSVYGGELVFESASSKNAHLQPVNNAMTYWYSFMTVD